MGKPGTVGSRVAGNGTLIGETVGGVALDQQGTVPGMRDFAAACASKEEILQQSRLLNDVLQTPEGGASDRVRREYSDATRMKVLDVAKRTLSTRQKRQNTEPPTPILARDEPGPSATTIESMVQHSRALRTAGFETEAEKIREQLKNLRSGSSKERKEYEQRLLKQQLTALEFSHKMLREQLAKAQAAEFADADEGWRAEAAELIASQARANQEFELRGELRVVSFNVELPSAPACATLALTHTCGTFLGSYAFCRARGHRTTTTAEQVPVQGVARRLRC